MSPDDSWVRKLLLSPAVNTVRGGADLSPCSHTATAWMEPVYEWVLSDLKMTQSTFTCTCQSVWKVPPRPWGSWPFLQEILKRHDIRINISSMAGHSDPGLRKDGENSWTEDRKSWGEPEEKDTETVMCGDREVICDPAEHLFFEADSLDLWQLTTILWKMCGLVSLYSSRTQPRFVVAEVLQFPLSLVLLPPEHPFLSAEKAAATPILKINK